MGWRAAVLSWVGVLALFTVLFPVGCSSRPPQNLEAEDASTLSSPLARLPLPATGSGCDAGAQCAPGQECDGNGDCVCDSTSCPDGCARSGPHAWRHVRRVRIPELGAMRPGGRPLPDLCEQPLRHQRHGRQQPEHRDLQLRQQYLRRRMLRGGHHGHVRALRLRVEHVVRHRRGLLRRVRHGPGVQRQRRVRV